MTEPRPHCERCDMHDCDGRPAMSAETSYIKAAGDKPEASIMRSAWEHAFMVWCKAQRALTRD